MKTSNIRVVVLDVYGTILAFDDPDYSCPSRKGLEDFLDACQARGIRVVTSSDAFVGNVKNDLERTFRLVIERMVTPKEKQAMRRRLSLARFDGFFQLDQGIKDFSIIIGHYDIIPSELLVIGDNPSKDIYGALRLGAKAIRCPVYGVKEGWDFDFGKIDLDIL